MGWPFFVVLRSGVANVTSWVPTVARRWTAGSHRRQTVDAIVNISTAWQRMATDVLHRLAADGYGAMY